MGRLKTKISYSRIIEICLPLAVFISLSQFQCLGRFNDVFIFAGK
jgi:hypothetical protein